MKAKLLWLYRFLWTYRGKSWRERVGHCGLQAMADSADMVFKTRKAQL